MAVDIETQVASCSGGPSDLVDDGLWEAEAPSVIDCEAIVVRHNRRGGEAYLRISNRLVVALGGESMDLAIPGTSIGRSFNRPTSPQRAVLEMSASGSSCDPASKYADFVGRWRAAGVWLSVREWSGKRADRRDGSE